MRNIALLGKKEMKGCKIGTSHAEGMLKMLLPQCTSSSHSGMSGMITVCDGWSLTKVYQRPSSQGCGHGTMP